MSGGGEIGAADAGIGIGRGAAEFVGDVITAVAQEAGLAARSLGRVGRIGGYGPETVVCGSEGEQGEGCEMVDVDFHLEW